MDPDHLGKLVEVAPRQALEEHVEQLTQAQFDICVRKEPGEALSFETACQKLSEEQFDFCIRKARGVALCDRRLYEMLSEEQFDFCIRKAPGVALSDRTLCKMLSGEQFDFCCRMDPAAALLCLRRLNPQQLQFCFEKAPAAGLWRHFSRYHRKLREEQFANCCRGAPAVALQMVARLMGKSLLDDCARAVPAFALIYVENRLDGAMFSACAAAEPLLALYICAERLTDDELVRHTKGRGAELKELLADPSKRSLILKLMPLLGRLDPDVESVVALASAPEI